MLHRPTFFKFAWFREERLRRPVYVRWACFMGALPPSCISAWGP